MQVRAGVLSILLLSFIPLHADDANELQKSLQHRFLKQVFVIRNFYGGDHLTFDAQGNLLHGAEPDCWCAAQIEVRKLEIKHNKLVLRGPRVIGFYDYGKRAFTSRLRQPAEVEIEIALDPVEMNQEAIVGVLEKIFLSEKDDLASSIPEPWRRKAPDSAAGEAANTNGDGPRIATTFAKVGRQGIKAPMPIYTPDPTYNKEARTKKREGNVMLWAVIDEKGLPRTIKVVQCLGAGLDEAAVEAVSHWRFAPATKDGQPVAVQLNIEVTFHLY